LKPARTMNSKQEKGQSTVEFALSVVTVMFVIFCCFELLMAVYTASVLADAAKEGVRYAEVHGSNTTLCSGPNTASPCANDPLANNVGAMVKNYAKASLHDTSAISVSVTYPDGTNDAPNRVVVTVSYTYVPYINLSFFHPTLTTHAQGRIVN